MATNYPTATDNGTSLPYPSATNDTNSPSLAGGQDNQNDAIIAVETLLGTNSTQTAPLVNTVLTSPANGSNLWQGLTSAFVQSATGTGDFVFANSPTLTSPTINTPTITSPSITGSLGNISTGTITASGATTLSSTLGVTGATTLSGLLTANGGLDLTGALTLPAGSITFADLLSTIFSGQLQSYSTSSGMGTYCSYVNIGGIKLMYGITGAVAFSTALAPYTLYLPPSFFTSISAILFNPTNPANTVLISAAVTEAIPSNPVTLPVDVQSATGSGNTQFFVFAVGA